MFSPLVERCQRQKSPGSPGALESQATWTWRTRPMAPSRSRRTIVPSAQAEKLAGTTAAICSGWARAARSIARASSALAAIRASVRTCLPASSAPIVTGAWSTGQAPTRTASSSGSATSASHDG